MNAEGHKMKSDYSNRSAKPRRSVWFRELSQLLGLFCEAQLTTEQANRLEELVLEHEEAKAFYVQYLHLHSTLLWDAALHPLPSSEDSRPLQQTFENLEVEGFSKSLPVSTVPISTEKGTDSSASPAGSLDKSKQLASRSPITDGLTSLQNALKNKWNLVASVTAILLLGGLAIWNTDRTSYDSWMAGLNTIRHKAYDWGTYSSVDSHSEVVIHSEHEDKPNENSPERPDRNVLDSVPRQQPLSSNHSVSSNSQGKNTEQINSPDSSPKSSSPKSSSPKSSSPKIVLSRDESQKPDKHQADSLQNSAPNRNNDPPANNTFVVDSNTQIVGMINRELSNSWELAGLVPSPYASDEEWLRRVTLDITGHIPSASVVRAFRVKKSSDKYARMIEELLASPDYNWNMSTIWSNLLVGRTPRKDVDSQSLSQWLRKSFSENKPWDKMVYDLVSAEGDSRENGAANYLLAHLNNQAVPATAITARLFLGVQIQCIQCHDHPFNDWKQNQFWELNSFFHQTTMSKKRKKDPVSGKVLTSVQIRSETSKAGPTWFESRRGLMRVAYPRFAGQSIESKSGINRREQLANLMIQGEEPLIAKAMVNRMWKHFFGAAFTTPLDDLGPHNPPTHPVLLQELTRSFVDHRYDVKQLIRWICLSDAYRRSSQFGSANQDDNPEVGNPPFFSRVYVKPMSIEQLYDSLMIATHPQNRFPLDWETQRNERTNWIRQFVHPFQTEENDEQLLFEGTVPQALSMMNGDLIAHALRLQSDSPLTRILDTEKTLEERVAQIALRTVSRMPTHQELDAVRKLIRQRSPRLSAATGSIQERTLRKHAIAESLQDLYWAYLNSSEFVLVH